MNASDIRTAMLARWCPPEWAIMWEVSDGTGVTGGRRYADAVLMSLWPSRGLELHGVEIKVTRSDWKREAEDPSKAELIAAYCDRWWVHTPKDLIADTSEVPPAWGLREYDGKRWHTKREAEKTEAKPMTRRFLASLLRRADTTMRADMDAAVRAAAAKEMETINALRNTIQKRVDDEVARRTDKYEKLAAREAEFNRILGRNAFNWGDLERYAAAIKAVYNVSMNGLCPAHELITNFRAAADALETLQQNLQK